MKLCTKIFVRKLKVVTILQCKQQHDTLFMALEVMIFPLKGNRRKRLGEGFRVHTKVKSNRIIYIDIAKGLGILLVVSGHLIGEGGISFSHSTAFHQIIYSFHMPLFFIISGILLGKSLRNKEYNAEFLRKKCKNIICHLGGAYFIWSIIYFLLGNPDGLANCKEWIICIFSFRGRAPIWFLGALMWAELLSVAIALFFHKKRNWSKVMLVILFAADIISWYYFKPSENLLMNYLNITVCRGILCSLFLQVGFELSNIILRKEKMVVSFFVFIISGFFCLLICRCSHIAVNLHLYDISNIWIFMMTGILGSISVIYFGKLLAAAIPRVKYYGLQLLGRDSLGIMVLHYTQLPFMVYAVSLCTFLHIEGIYKFFVSLTIVMIISIVGTELIKKRLLIGSK